MKGCSFLFGLAVAFTAASVTFAGPFVFQTAAVPTDTFTQLLGINNAGTIAGYHGAVVNQGFTLTLPGNFVSENFPGSVQTQVVAINAAGDTAGFYVDAAGATHGFTKIGATFTTVDAGGTAFNQILGINSADLLAGYSSLDPAGATLQRAFTSNGTTFSYITGFPIGTGNSQATGVNNAGNVSGFYVDSGGVNHGFLVIGGLFSTLDYPGSTFTQALGLNNVGQVVGTYVDAAMSMHGFIESNGIFQSIDAPGGVGTTTVNGINDLGKIVGFFVDGNDNTVGFAATATAVPEPVTFSLGGIGLVALGLLRRGLSS